MATSSVEKMNGPDWLTVADNPRQRNTEAHWQRSKDKHLKEASETHRHVAMARSKDGQQWKLDGHTRAYAWANGYLPTPGTVFVTVYSVKSEAEACDLYTHFDNKAAAETATDQVSGAFHQSGIVAQSSLFKKGAAVKGALINCDHILRGLVPSTSEITPIYDLLGEWKPEIKLLDALLPPNGKFNTFTLTGAFLILRKYPKEAERFIEDVLGDQGVKRGISRDGVEAACEVMQTKVPTDRRKGINLAAAFIWCFERWRQDEMITRIQYQIEIMNYLNSTSNQMTRPTSARVKGLVYPIISAARNPANQIKVKPGMAAETRLLRTA